MTTALDMVVHAVRAVARDVFSVELRARDGRLLTGAAPGAHIDLHLPGKLVRQYSLVDALGAPTQPAYTIAVGRDANSRGGSAWVHDHLRVGQALRIGGPRNLFAMDPAHRRVLLVAGGIGVTPIYAMARHCAAAGLDWTLLACARSAPRLAYLEELKALAGPRLATHFDDEHGGRADLTSWLMRNDWQGVYACGPAPMLDALQSAAAHWPAGRLHLERFGAQAVDTSADRAFELVLSRSTLSTQVAAQESVLDALERLGVEHPWSCREGLCGTCEATVLHGAPDHRDSVLDSAARSAGNRIIPCVSRCGGARLVLDL